jgi:hypothetical protein
MNSMFQTSASSRHQGQESLPSLAMKSGADMGKTTWRIPSSSTLRRLQGLLVHSSKGQLLTHVDFESASKIIAL